jgi:hypothetical protein
MQIDNISSHGIEARRPEPKAATRPNRAARDTADFSQTQGLEQALNTTPASRGEEVARAKTLVSSLRYPPDELINGISELLAFHGRKSSS